MSGRRGRHSGQLYRLVIGVLVRACVCVSVYVCMYIINVHFLIIFHCTYILYIPFGINGIFANEKKVIIPMA